VVIFMYIEALHFVLLEVIATPSATYS
jgi:hypothetical protein